MSTRALDRRLWVAAGLAAAAVLAALTWLVVVGPHRDEAGQLRDDTETVQAQNLALAGKTSALKRQAGGRDQLRAGLRTALAQLPPTADLPSLSRQLSSQARSHGVTVTGIDVGSPAPPATALSTTAVDPPTDSTTAPATATAPAAAPTTVLAISVTIRSEGTAIDQLRFLRDLQRVGPRRVLVTGTSLSSKNKRSVKSGSTMTTQLSVFTSALSEDEQTQLTDLLGGDGSD